MVNFEENCYLRTVLLKQRLLELSSLIFAVSDQDKQSNRSFTTRDFLLLLNHDKKKTFPLCKTNLVLTSTCITNSFALLDVFRSHFVPTLDYMISA